MPTDITWPNIEAFYDDNPSGHRRRSPEVDFGVWWRWAPGTCSTCEAAVVVCRRCGVAVPNHPGWGPTESGWGDDPFIHPIDGACPSCQSTRVPVQQSPHRVTYVVDTGEFIAVRSSDGRVRRFGRVNATIPADHYSPMLVREASRALAHRILDGWTDAMADETLAWVADRVAAAANRTT